MFNLKTHSVMGQVAMQPNVTDFPIGIHQNPFVESIEVAEVVDIAPPLAAYKHPSEALH